MTTAVNSMTWNPTATNITGFAAFSASVSAAPSGSGSNGPRQRRHSFTLGPKPGSPATNAQKAPCARRASGQYQSTCVSAFGIGQLQLTGVSAPPVSPDYSWFEGDDPIPALPSPGTACALTPDKNQVAVSFLVDWILEGRTSKSGEHGLKICRCHLEGTITWVHMDANEAVIVTSLLSRYVAKKKITSAIRMSRKFHCALYTMRAMHQDAFIPRYFWKHITSKPHADFLDDVFRFCQVLDYETFTRPEEFSRAKAELLQHAPKLGGHAPKLGGHVASSVAAWVAAARDNCTSRRASFTSNESVRMSPSLLHLSCSSEVSNNSCLSLSHVPDAPPCWSDVEQPKAGDLGRGRGISDGTSNQSPLWPCAEMLTEVDSEHVTSFEDLKRHSLNSPNPDP